MRTAYHAWLTALDHAVVDLSGQVARAIRWAADSVLNDDLHQAQSAISALSDIADAAEEISDQAAAIMARQQPVAHDLRRLLGAQKAAASLQAMGRLAASIGKVTRRRYPKTIAPPEVRGVLADMVALSQRLSVLVGEVLNSHHVAYPNLAVGVFEQMQQLHKEMLAIVRSPAWPHDVATAVDMTMLSRDFVELAEYGLDLVSVVLYVEKGTADPGFRSS